MCQGQPRLLNFSAACCVCEPVGSLWSCILVPPLQDVYAILKYGSWYVHLPVNSDPSLVPKWKAGTIVQQDSQRVFAMVLNLRKGVSWMRL